MYTIIHVSLNGRGRIQVGLRITKTPRDAREGLCCGAAMQRNPAQWAMGPNGAPNQPGPVCAIAIVSQNGPRAAAAACACAHKRGRRPGTKPAQFSKGPDRTRRAPSYDDPGQVASIPSAAADRNRRMRS